jgi:hypothetical protein
MLALNNFPFSFRNIFIIFSVLFFTVISCSTKSTPSYQLTTSSVPAEGGSVSPSSGEFDEGDEVQLQATANQDWMFDGWEGDQTGSQNPVTVTMDADKAINARFVKRQYPLTINVQGEGSVSETVVQTKMTDYDAGTIVELEANSDMGYNFARWEGAIESTDNPVQITVDGPKEVTVVFELNEFTVQVRAEGPGDVSKDPEKEIYVYNETVQFEADPDPGNEFLGWFNESGSFEMLEAEFEYQITEDLDIAAFFSSVENAFVIETVDIITADGIVDRVIFNVLNFLLGDVTLAGAVVSDEEGEEVAAIEFDGPPVLPGRSGAEVTVTFEGEGIDENVINDWVFNWLFDYKGERYEKDQEIGEPGSNAKKKPESLIEIETRNSIQINIK